MTGIMLNYGSHFRRPSANTELKGLRCFEANSDVIKTLKRVGWDIFGTYEAFLRRLILRVPNTLTYSPAALKIMLVNMIMSHRARMKEAQAQVTPDEEGSLVSGLALINFLLKTEEDQPVSDTLAAAFLSAVKSLPDSHWTAFDALNELLPRVEFLRVFHCSDSVIEAILYGFAEISGADGSYNYKDALEYIQDIDLMQISVKGTSEAGAALRGGALASTLAEYAVESRVEYNEFRSELESADQRDAYLVSLADRGNLFFSETYSTELEDEESNSFEAKITAETEAQTDSESGSDPGSVKGEKTVSASKEGTLTFEGVIIRHGESAWNQAKAQKADRPSPASNNFMSSKAFPDAELSETGVNQCELLRDVVSMAPSEIFDWEDSLIIKRDIAARTRGFQILNGSDPGIAEKTILLTSNMRRAMLTGLIALALRPKCHHTPETVHILSSAQELSFMLAADARCLTPARKTPDLGRDFAVYFEKFKYDNTHNFGDQNSRSRGGKDDGRLGMFCEEMASMMKDSGKEFFVLSGHSTWIQAFFRKYLSNPENDLETQLKQEGVKLGNASVISVKLDVMEFTNFLGNPGFECRLQAGQTKLVYGFLQRKSKKSK